MQYRNTSIVQSVTQLQPCEHCCALLQIKIVFIYIMRLAAIGEKLRLINFVSTEIVYLYSNNGINSIKFQRVLEYIFLFMSI